MKVHEKVLLLIHKLLVHWTANVIEFYFLLFIICKFIGLHICNIVHILLLFMNRKFIGLHMSLSSIFCSSYNVNTLDCICHRVLIFVVYKLQVHWTAYFTIIAPLIQRNVTVNPVLFAVILLTLPTSTHYKLVILFIYT